ncbi:MAG: LysR family transcriptional regulator [Gemmatimonadaceae bacterium]|jgi:DNA-binding transcriptional LysR family regulator|nr:LysR family transcriptional regulator [Gemmatimonadaceae bacterium]
MDVRALRLFTDLARLGSIASVSRARGSDPSVLSRELAALEREVGVRLFHRTTRRLALTEAGAIYLDRVEPLVAELEDASLRARDAVTQPSGTLRVAAPVSFGQLNLVPLLGAFVARYPAVSLDLILTDGAPNLAEERIDVALRLGPLADPSLIARRVATMRVVACASPAYLARRGTPSAPADLARHDCLLLAMPGFGDRWRFTRETTGETIELTVRGRLRTSNAVALRDCALDGMGIIAQARWIVGRELRTGRLVEVLPEWTVHPALGEDPAMWLVYPSREYVPLKVRAFADWVTDRLARTPWEVGVRE